jgi:hypothetical protein
MQQHSIQYRAVYHLPFGGTFVPSNAMEGRTIRPSRFPTGDP